MNQKAQEALFGKGGIDAFVDNQMAFAFPDEKTTSEKKKTWENYDEELDGVPAREDMASSELELWVATNSSSIFYFLDESKVVIERADIRELKDSGWYETVSIERNSIRVNGSIFRVDFEIWKNGARPNDYRLYIPKSRLALEIRKFLENE